MAALIDAESGGLHPFELHKRVGCSAKDPQTKAAETRLRDNGYWRRYTPSGMTWQPPPAPPAVTTADLVARVEATPGLSLRRLLDKLPEGAVSRVEDAMNEGSIVEAALDKLSPVYWPPVRRCAELAADAEPGERRERLLCRMLGSDLEARAK